jgi:hypothetical protein
MHTAAQGMALGRSMQDWLDVWHTVLAIVARQPPFAQIMIATGAVFVAVMALEGIRTSLLAIRHAHKTVPAPAPHEALPPEPVTLAMPAAPRAAKAFSARATARPAAAAPRRPKPLTLSPRQFRSPRPTIRRHAAFLSALSESPAHAALETSNAL